MAQAANPETGCHDEIGRLQQELEQNRVALEDAHTEIAAFAVDNVSLKRAVAELEAARATAVADAIRARELAARNSMRAAESMRDLATAEQLRVALEETSVLAEELRETNVALDQANSTLELLNADLSRRIEMESAARSQAQAELFKLQKLEAIGQLTGGIAHDFNNLLTVIISGLQLLGQVRDAAHRDRVLSRIQEAAWRGAHLTQRLLAFARRQPLRPARLDLPRQMDSMRELLTHALREDIAMHVDLPPNIWPVEVDVAALELALLNLAVNARDAMPDGGALRLAARNHPMPNGGTGRLELAPGDYVDISLTDTGSGMAPELMDKVFEPFFSTKPDGKGTGLGLAQVYGFARQSDGGAWLESTQGVGTAVHLLLPRSRRAFVPAPVEPPAPPRVVRRREQLKVLVVEDDDNVAALVLEMLGQLGHSGTRAATVASALAVLATADDYDLVFSDVLLPGGSSGLDLAREMGRRRMELPLILTSGFGGGMTQRLASASLPFLRKPYRIEALSQAIDTALHSPTALPRESLGSL